MTDGPSDSKVEPKDVSEQLPKTTLGSLLQHKREDSKSRESASKTQSTSQIEIESKPASKLITQHNEKEEKGVLESTKAPKHPETMLMKANKEMKKAEVLASKQVKKAQTLQIQEEKKSAPRIGGPKMSPSESLRSKAKYPISERSKSFQAQNTPIRRKNWLDSEKFRSKFYQNTLEFTDQIDLYFKNYNKFVRESRKNIELQVKATKKERVQYMDFIAREEINFWSEFPRKLKFHDNGLFEIHRFVEIASNKVAAGVSSSQSTTDVKDIDMAVMTILDFMPFSSRKFCQLFNLKPKEYCTDEDWRSKGRSTASVSSRDLFRSTATDKTLNSAADVSSTRRFISQITNQSTGQGPIVAEQVSTFDQLTQSLKMFDADDLRNWQILGLTACLFAADTLAVILDQKSALSEDLLRKKQGQAKQSGEKNQSPKIYISAEVAQKLISYCKLMANLQFEPSEDDPLDSLTVVEHILDKVQFTWSFKIYPSLARVSREQFDQCLKFLQGALQNDHRVYSEKDIDCFIKEIYFSRHLVITPKDLDIAEKVLGLLERFHQMLTSEHCSDSFKQGLLATLKYLVSHLCFYKATVCGYPNIVPLRGIQFNSQSMQIQIATINKLYSVVEQLAKKDVFRDHAVLLMASILKISSEDFVVQRLPNFLSLIKFNNFFKSRRSYVQELKIVNQLYLTGQIHLQSYKAYAPKLETNRKLLIENQPLKILVPIVNRVVPIDDIYLARNTLMPNVPESLLPQGVSNQASNSAGHLIWSIPDMFRLIFNPRLVNFKANIVDHSHWQFLKQATFDDFDFISTQGIQMLLDERWSDQGSLLLNLGLKLADFILDPQKNFKSHYMALHGGAHSQKSMRIGQQIKNMRKSVSQTIKHVLSNRLFLNSDFMKANFNHFKDSETKDACQDQTQAIFTQTNWEMVLHEAVQVSQDLQNQNLTKFHLQERLRVIIFEDLNELEAKDFIYEDEYLNQLLQEIDVATCGGVSTFDPKKEKFYRKRIQSFVAENTTGRQSLKKDSAPLKQNPSYFKPIQNQDKTALKLIRQIMKMIHYLPDIHHIMKDFPTMGVTRQINGVLSNRTHPLKFAFEETEEEQKRNQVGVVENQDIPIQLDPHNLNDLNENSDKSTKLSEVSMSIPFCLLSLNYKLAKSTAKALYKLMIFGDLATKIAMVDQVLYLIKELMIDSPEDYLLKQLIFTLTNMVKIWHQSEITKFEAVVNDQICVGKFLGGFPIVDLVSAGGESLEENSNSSGGNMYRDLHQHLQMFDLLDFVSLVSMCNKDQLLRSLACILSTETGKLKRLLVHKDKQRNQLNDILYHHKGKIIEQVVSQLALYYSFKGQGFRSTTDFNCLFNEVDIFEFVVDNFEYQKVGLSESLVRDIQVLLIGSIARMWKRNLMTYTKIGGVILNFVQQISCKTLQLFESRSSDSNDIACSTSPIKDSVGFNLLLAIVLSNVTKSHNEQNRILSKGQSEEQSSEDGAGSEPDEVFSSGHLTSNTILDEVKTLVSLAETEFNKMHRVSFKNIYPSRFWTSNILLSFLYYLQEPIDQKSLSNLQEIFIIQRRNLDDKSSNFVENCLIFYACLCSNSNQEFFSYCEEQIKQNLKNKQVLDELRNNDDQQEQSSLSQSQNQFPVSQNLKQMAQILIEVLEEIEFLDDSQGKKKLILRISMAQTICMYIRKLRKIFGNQVRASDYLPLSFQMSLFCETRSQFSQICKSSDLVWLSPFIKQIWFSLLSFEQICGNNQPETDESCVDDESISASKISTASKSKLFDLKFLIQLEQDGFQGALKFYKLFGNQMQETSTNTRIIQAHENARVNEIKLLIQHIYAFYGNNRPPSMQPTVNLESEFPNISNLSAFGNTEQSSLYSHFEQPVGRNKNVYYKCLVNCVFDTQQLLVDLENLKESSDMTEKSLLENKSQLPSKIHSKFAKIYTTLVKSVFKNQKTSLETKLRKLSSGNLHAKFFLVGIFMALNSTDKVLIEKSKILSICVLPLMFPDLEYRREVEENIIKFAQAGQIKALIGHESRRFYQFIKRIFVAEEAFNMENHFERYFSLSGFMRDILNEIIKLQSSDDADQPKITPKMMLKVLDIVTYFFSGNLDLRRAPKGSQVEEQGLVSPGQKTYGKSVPEDVENQTDSFIFAHLIDYKSFEFLSKLYKITEKLVDYDSEMLVMNLWYKIVEAKPHNFEILAKFLIHNLSSFIMKLRANNNQSEQSQLSKKDGNNQASPSAEDQYGIEYEKQKRYSLSIFNYIKARKPQQIDLRNSLALSGVAWSQKMVRLSLRAQLNLHSKYALEKLKLKDMLSKLHGEINQSGLRLLFKGGLNEMAQVIQDKQGEIECDDPRRSVSMGDLLKSTTFNETFGGGNITQKATMKQLIFVMGRQVSEQFDLLTPESQLQQLPDLIMKYYENTLIMVANEAERLQVIAYSVKEEAIITCIILMLLADLATQDSDINRYYFMYDLLNKLVCNIPGLQRFLRIQNLKKIEDFQSLSTPDDLIFIFNHRHIVENFGKFSQIFFKIVQNVVIIGKLHKFMLKLWHKIYLKVQQQLQRSDLAQSSQPASLRPLYTENQILAMLQVSFFSLHNLSIKLNRYRGVNISNDQRQEVKKSCNLSLINLKSQIESIIDAVLPKNFKNQTLKDFNDPFARQISLASNVCFWLSFICLETNALFQLKQNGNNFEESFAGQSEASMSFDQSIESGINNEDSIGLQNEFREILTSLQELGAESIRRLLEESEFFKLLINNQTLSNNFYQYSLALQNKQFALLPLLFNSLKNLNCVEDVYKSLIVTIRIQDSRLLMCANQESEDNSYMIIHRFFLLIPFLAQQFLGYEDQESIDSSKLINMRRSTTIFQSKSSIVQLLKKSLLGIGIDKKAAILTIVDEIAQESNQDREGRLRDLFVRLTSATVETCIQLDYQSIIFSSVQIFQSILAQIEEKKQSKDFIDSQQNLIEVKLLTSLINVMQEAIESNQLSSNLDQNYVSPTDQQIKNSYEKLYMYKIDQQTNLLGEDLGKIHRDIRPLYFNMKNLVLKEISNVGLDLDIYSFFVKEEHAGIPLQRGADPYSMARSRSNIQGQTTGQIIIGTTAAQGSVGRINEIAADLISAESIPSQGYNASSVKHVKKGASRKQELVSKYANSQNTVPKKDQVNIKIASPILSSSKNPSKVEQLEQFGIRQSPTRIQEGRERKLSGAGSSQIQQTLVQRDQNLSVDDDFVLTEIDTDKNQIDQDYAEVITDLNGPQNDDRESQQKAFEEQASRMLFEEDDEEIDGVPQTVNISDGDKKISKITEDQNNQILAEINQEKQEVQQTITERRFLDGQDPREIMGKNMLTSTVTEKVVQKGHLEDGRTRMATVKYQNQNIFKDPQQPIGIAQQQSESDMNDFAGLIGTFAKPRGLETDRNANDVDQQSLANPVSEVGGTNQQQFRGEVALDRDFLNQDQTCLSSIDVDYLEQKKRVGGVSIPALVPNFVQEKITETDSNNEKQFGTGEFAPSQNDLAKIRQAFKKDDFNFCDDKNQNTNAQETMEIAEQINRPQTTTATQIQQVPQNNKDNLVVDFSPQQNRLETPFVERVADSAQNVDRNTQAVSQTKAQQASGLPQPKVNQLIIPPINAKAAQILSENPSDNLPTPKKSQTLDTLLIDVLNDEEQFFQLETFLSEKKNYDVDNLAFYIKVMEFRREGDQMNATVAAGMIIDNYLSECAQYYIGNELREDEAISRLIQDYERCIEMQNEVPKDLFDPICYQIKNQLIPFVREFQQNHQ